MARRRKSSIGRSKPRKVGAQELKRQRYMSMASSGHLDDPRFGFSSEKNGKKDVCVFYARFAAKKFLDLMIDEDEIEWEGDTTIHTSCGVMIRGEQLQKIFNHKLTYNEERYHEFDESHLRRVIVIRDDSFARPFVQGETVKNARRHSRKGMVLMKQIAEELGITPRVARGILRGVMRKPKHGWAWRTTEEVEEIKRILLGNKLRIDFTGVKKNAVLDEGQPHGPLAFRVRRSQGQDPA